MDDSELERTPNPFSAFADSRPQSRRNLAAAAKLLLAAIAIFCVVVISQVYLQRARLTDILNGFSTQSTNQKLDHLRHLQASGVEGIRGIVAAIADDQPEVSSSAVEMISELNHDWTTLPTDQMRECRLAFADALVKVSKQIDDPADPRWARIHTLARLAAEDLIGLPDAENEAAFRSLMQIIGDDSKDSIALHSQSVATAQPLPMDWVEQTGTDWTDWPPASLAPTLYRRKVATLRSDNEPSVLSQQADDADHSSVSAARLLKPTFRPAATLADHAQQTQSSDVQSSDVQSSNVQSTEYWITQLESLSRLVRLQAVTELGVRGDQQAIRALRTHQKTESDPTVALRIRKRLDL